VPNSQIEIRGGKTIVNAPEQFFSGLSEFLKAHNRQQRPFFDFLKIVLSYTTLISALFLNNRLCSFYSEVVNNFVQSSKVKANGCEFFPRIRGHIRAMIELLSIPL